MYKAWARRNGYMMFISVYILWTKLRTYYWSFSLSVWYKRETNGPSTEILIFHLRMWPANTKASLYIMNAHIIEPWHVFRQCGILTNVESYESVQPLFKLRNSKWCLVSSWTLKEYFSDKQWLWSDCAYAQADLRLCWSHTPHCWKFHVAAHRRRACA